MPVPSSDVTKLTHDAIIELFDLDLNPIGTNQIFRFCNWNQVSLANVVWKGNTYQAIPIQASGFEYSGRGQLPTPQIVVGNVFSAMSAILLQYDDLVGCKLTRHRTLAKYLDGQPGADSTQEFEDDIWFVDRKVSESKLGVTLELASALELTGLQLPKRVIIANLCGWVYKSAECSYTGGLADCDKSLTGTNGCKAHFGAYATLPFGGFPGVDNQRQG